MDTNIIETTMILPDFHARAIIQLEDGRVSSCLTDGTVKVWKIDSGQCDLIFNRRGIILLCVIQLADGRICTGSLKKIDWDLG